MWKTNNFNGEKIWYSEEEYKRLQQENEELKKENKELLNLSNNGGALLVAESTKNKKYKQALEEIKDYCIKTTSRPLERKFILTIIVEALNEQK